MAQSKTGGKCIKGEARDDGRGNDLWQKGKEAGKIESNIETYITICKIDS